MHSIAASSSQIPSSQINVLLGQNPGNASSTTNAANTRETDALNPVQRDSDNSNAPANANARKSQDSAQLSNAGQAALAAEEQARSDSSKTDGQNTDKNTTTDTDKADAAKNTGKTDTTGKPLSDADLATIQQLKQSDSKVRQHEQAHKASAGANAVGGVNLDYQSGPDGQRYAVGGHVNIDTGKANDPQATIQKMDTVQRAALAPADPSAQDRAVAASAAQQKNQAIAELRQQQIDKQADQQAQPADDAAATKADNTRDDKSTAQTTSAEKTSSSSSDIANKDPRASVNSAANNSALQVADNNQRIADQASLEQVLQRQHIDLSA